MNASLVLTARMGSSRLPGKSLKRVGPYSVLGVFIRRLKASRHAQNLVVATSDLPQDDVIAEKADELGVTCVRGSEEDVLGRVVRAACENGSPIVVRLTGDCPLNDPRVIDAAVDMFADGDYDLVTTKYNYPMGIDCEVLSLKLLKHLNQVALSQAEREHVTLRIWNKVEEFKCVSMSAPEGLDCPELVLTLDDQEDLERIDRICTHFGEDIATVSAQDIVRHVLANPSLKKIRTVPRGF